jgi:hypothetical protein
VIAVCHSRLSSLLVFGGCFVWRLPMVGNHKQKKGAVLADSPFGCVSCAVAPVVID